MYVAPTNPRIRTDFATKCAQLFFEILEIKECTPSASEKPHTQMFIKNVKMNDASGVAAYAESNKLS
jgi:hypothetical protein